MIHLKIRRRRWILTQFVALLVIPASVTRAEITTLVTPPGFEDVEGESVFNPQRRYPSDNEPPLPNGIRVQELHRASEFASLGPGPLRITQLAFRPDVSVDQPLSVEWNLTALNLSTTTVDPGSMSAVFDNNYGSDGFTTVLSGIVPLTTDGVPRPGGLPRDFGYVFEFETPYVYDPEQGNLLVEFISPTDLASTWQDATASGAGGGRFLFAPAAGAEVAVLSLPLITIAQFTVEPEPSTFTLEGDYNDNGTVEQADLDLVLLNWGDMTPPIPAGWDDDLPSGDIDQEELDKVLLNWGSRAPPLGANSVPEPRSAVLLLLGLVAAIQTLCRWG